MYRNIRIWNQVSFSHYNVFRRSIPKSFEEYVVTAPRWTASICWERNKEEEFHARPIKSFHHEQLQHILQNSEVHFFWKHCSDCRKLNFLISYPVDHFSLLTNVSKHSNPKPNFLISYPTDHLSLLTNILKHSNPKPASLQSLVTAGNFLVSSCKNMDKIAWVSWKKKGRNFLPTPVTVTVTAQSLIWQPPLVILKLIWLFLFIQSHTP